ncbi:MAG: GAF domain-containing protein [Candidatus Rokubacteria bacterium]|nr:GAF domain-containing protein [Candidatus Rokubacteria bacterium]
MGLSALLPRSLRARLLAVFLGLALLPPGIGSLYVYHHHERALRTLRLEHLDAVAGLKSERINAWVTALRDAIAQPAAMPAAQALVADLFEASPDRRRRAEVRIRANLSKFVESGRFAEAFVLEGATGRVLVSTDPAEEGKFKDDRPYFREGHAGSSAQRVYYALALREPAIAFAAPVHGAEGRPRAILVGRAALGFVDRIIGDRSGLGRTGRAFLVDQSNLVVSESLGRLPEGRRPVFSDGIRRALAGDAGATFYVNHDGRRVAAAYRRLPALGLGLVLETDEAEALAPIHVFRSTLAAALGVAALLSVAAGLILALSLGRPLVRLADAARQFGAGQLDHRVEIEEPSEFAVLGRSMNQMADDLGRSRREIEAHGEALERRVAERTAESEARRRAAEALAEIGRSISQSLDADTVVRQITESITRLLQAKNSSLFELDAESGDLIVVASAGEDAGRLEKGLRFPRGTGTAGLAVQQRETIVAANLLDDARITLTPELRAHIETRNYRAVLAVPLRSGDRVTGALAIGAVPGRVFTADDVRLVEAFAAQATIALENARLYRRSEERARKLTTLSSITRLIASASDSDHVFEAVAEAAVGLLGAKAAYVWTEDATRQVLVPRARRAADPDTEATIRAQGLPSLARTSGVIGGVVDTRAAEFIADIQKDARWLNRALIEALDLHGCVVMPLLVDDDAVGVMTIVWGEPGEFSAETRELIQLLADHAAIAIRNARLLEALTLRQGRLEALLGATTELACLQPVELVLERIAEACGHLLATDSVGFRLVEGDDLVMAAATGDARELMRRQRLKIGESLSGIVAATGEPLRVDDPANDARTISVHREVLRGSRHRAWLGVPVKAGDRLVGVLSVRTRNERGFSPDDVAAATAFAAQAAVALENARLYREARRAYEELASTQGQLLQAQKMDAIGRLAGGIAHDFNNLLTVIIGRATLLVQGATPQDRERKPLELILATAERAAGLTAKLLAFSRKQVFQPKLLDVNALVGDFAPMLERLIGEDVTLRIIAGPGLRRVKADPSQLEQVVMNLAVNARDAMPRGGRLTIETANVELDGEFLRRHPRASAAPHVALMVRDTGCGMDEATLAHMFEPFFTTKLPGHGTGLGLSTVYGIVQQSDGFIDATSVPGAGTTFRIYLPGTEEAAAAALPAAPAPPARGTETVLLVEDDDDVRDLTQDVLAQHGYRVLTARDSREALQMVERHRDGLALLITDLIMPDMNGRQLAEAVGRSDPDLKVLFLSGYSEDILSTRAAIDPAIRLVQKPFTPAVLIAEVRRLLDGDLANLSV